MPVRRLMSRLTNTIAAIGDRIGWPRHFVARRLWFRELQEIARLREPKLEPYQSLAAFWPEYCGRDQSHYEQYFKLLAGQNGAKPQSVLDLACGTGALTSLLANSVPEVVGLDLSEAMLAKARACHSDQPGIQLIPGDFRDFNLDRCFNLVVCAFNSINYVRNASELHAVFKCVARHLRPGGQFCFDTITTRGSKRLAGLYAHVTTSAGRFVIHYERNNREINHQAIVLTAAGAEIHPRIGIDPKTVREAARKSGLEIEKYSGQGMLSERWYFQQSCLFILRRT